MKIIGLYINKLDWCPTEIVRIYNKLDAKSESKAFIGSSPVSQVQKDLKPRISLKLCRYLTKIQKDQDPE